MTQVTFLRTPDDRFRPLQDFPYEPHYVDSLPGYEGLRAHYLDVRPKDAARTFLCLHGEPTWSYLYRKMIPIFLESGARAVAPDFFGFGRSDKPVDESTYTFHFHRDFILRIVEYLDLTGITLVVQDWGATLGLTLPTARDFRSRLDRLLVMNTVLPVGEPLSPHFYEWRSMVRGMPDLPVGQMIRRITPQLTAQEEAAYEAPFPDTEGVAEAKAAVKFWSQDWTGKSFMAIGAKAPDMDDMQELRGQIRGCPEPLIVEEADHFVPEWGDSVARAALRSFGDLR